MHSGVPGPGRAHVPLAVGAENLNLRGRRYASARGVGAVDAAHPSRRRLTDDVRDVRAHRRIRRDERVRRRPRQVAPLVRRRRGGAAEAASRRRAATVSAAASSGLTSSRTMIPRPCVATMRSFVSSFRMTRSTRTGGMLPVARVQWRAAVERPVQPELGPEEEQVRIARMLLDRSRDDAVRQVAGDRRPRRAAIGRPEDVRREVVVVVAVEHDVRHARVDARRQHLADPPRCRAAGTGS